MVDLLLQLLTLDPRRWLALGAAPPLISQLLSLLTFL